MDRLSELPDDVIFHIFWLLPLNDVVRTTILSKRWLNLWTTIPFLNFDNCKSFSGTKQFRNFVNQVLLRWDGVRVLKFKVDSSDKLEGKMYKDIVSWVRFAKKYEVEELYLHTWSDPDQQVCRVPKCLYSCSSLKDLSIKNCYFKINRNVQWNQLKSLTIIKGFGVTQHVIHQILSGSPLLEVLVLSFLERGESLCFRSSSLKELSIRKYVYCCSELSLHTELTIWTPNLKALEIKGSPYRKCLLLDVSSLTHATLGFSGLHLQGRDCDFSGNSLLATNTFLEDLFSQILPSIQHVKTVKLWSCCTMVLGAMTERCTNSSFPNVKSLHLRYLLDHNALVGILGIFLGAKKLVLKVKKKDEYNDDLESFHSDARIYLKLKEYLPESFLLQLRTVEVASVEGSRMFRFLEFLLKNASKLEEIVFREEGIMPPSYPSDSLFVAAKKLRRMPRSSPVTRIIIEL